ncbi:MAG: tRNA methyl transferase PRC-barrel domain-containing protein [Thermoleophilia bacterium]
MTAFRGFRGADANGLCGTSIPPQRVPTVRTGGGRAAVAASWRPTVRLLPRAHALAPLVSASAWARVPRPARRRVPWPHGGRGGRRRRARRRLGLAAPRGRRRARGRRDRRGGGGRGARTRRQGPHAARGRVGAGAPARARRAPRRARPGRQGPARQGAGARRDERRRRQRGGAPRGPGRRPAPGRGDAAALGRPAGWGRRARMLLARLRAGRPVALPRAGAPARDPRPARRLPHPGRRAVRRGVRARETPNPCVRCNGSFRFDELAALARRLGAQRLATGHYARLVERDGQLLVARGTDPEKDQSYMLARVSPRVLARLWLPLGDGTKQETRTRAAAAGLAAAARPESQEACFLGGGDYRAFLARHGLEPRRGEIVDPAGRALGTHDGYWRFTPGQRRGLGVASADGPIYAIRVDPRRNLVQVGPRAALARREVTCRDGRLRVPADRVEVKLRSRSAAVPGRVEARARGFRLELDEPVHGVAPGQLAALYVDDAIVGAGTVSRSA